MSNGTLEKFFAGNTFKVARNIDAFERNKAEILELAKESNLRELAANKTILPECADCPKFYLRQNVIAHPRFMSAHDAVETTIRCTAPETGEVCGHRFPQIDPSELLNKLTGDYTRDQNALYGKWDFDPRPQDEAYPYPTNLAQKALASSLNDLTARVSDVDDTIKRLKIRAMANDVFTRAAQRKALITDINNQKAESWDGYFDDSDLAAEPEPPKKTPEELQKELEEGSDELAGITKDMPRSGGVAW
ncbi:hypothetical protein ACN1NW_000469 [Acinetobacter baumannii]|nr:hypothetical protein [Acinetobacter baumannii]ELA7031051.1 hypothetical protein [Acinetobacter baumannii]ELA7118814.1 hypothetical protein [Acinetobacter baumannii]ELB0919764.1 hypothetical protein [Acinetobacter baumannii]ELB0965941.1 hypothetical protein [Acinetobacter baumannii]